MTKPVILTVDDDTEVLRAIERDLRRQYASNYRVLRAESGTAALDIVQRIETPQQRDRTLSRGSANARPVRCRILRTGHRPFSRR